MMKREEGRGRGIRGLGSVQGVQGIGGVRGIGGVEGVGFRDPNPHNFI